MKQILLNGTESDETYKRIGEEDQLQKCVHLNTGKEDHLKQRALSVIRAAVAALYR